jgi:hypothetical protein
MSKHEPRQSWGGSFEQFERLYGKNTYRNSAPLDEINVYTVHKCLERYLPEVETDGWMMR